MKVVQDGVKKNPDAGVQKGNWKPKAWWLGDGGAIFWEETKGLGLCFRAEKAEGKQSEV